MSRNSIGQFIAALRKTNGMTQQEVADRLNVSNKAVSRWERDECSPDITVIPALAELLGVTCDELLKGERIHEQMPYREPKVEKQLKNLINKTLSGFKNLIWISISVAIVGLVCMFGIAYGFYQPIIGFVVMFLFEACAFVLAVLGVTRTRDVKNENELFDSAEITLINKFNRTLSSFSFASFFVILTSVLLGVPFLIETGGVLTFGSYVFGTLWLFGLILILVYFGVKKRYMAWVINTPYIRDSYPQLKRMNLIQIGSVIAAGILFIIAPFFERGWREVSYTVIVLNIIALAFLLADLVCFIVFMIKYRETRKRLILPGIRNVLLSVSAYLISGFHHISYYQFSGSTVYERCSSWNHEYFIYTLASTLIIFAGFKTTEYFIMRTAKKQH